MLFVLKNITVIIYITGFVCLAAVSIWDVYSIIDSYYNDNRLTMVTRKNSTTSYPFIVNPTVSVTSADPFFPWHPVSPDQFLAMLKASWRLGDKDNNKDPSTTVVPWPRKMTPQEMSMALDLFKLITFGLIVRGFDYQREYVLIQPPLFPKEDVEAFHEQFLRDPDYSTRAIVAAQKSLKPLFMWTDSGELGPVFFDFDTIYSYKYELPIVEGRAGGDEAAGITRFQRSFYTDIVYMTRDDEEDMNNKRSKTRSSSFNLMFGDSAETINIDGGPPNVTTWTQIQITNEGVFDSSRFPPCASEFKTRWDCAEDAARRASADSCGCTMFSDYVRKAILANGNSTSTNAPPRPFCSMKKHRACLENAKSLVDKQRGAEHFATYGIASWACSEPCVTSSNKHEVEREVLRHFMHQWSEDQPWKPRVEMMFLCDQKQYLLYEDKPQTSLPQLISQVGGDLGLYVGFSMMSLLQVLLFVYQFQQEGQTAGASHPAAVSNRRRFFADRLSFVRRYVSKRLIDWVGLVEIDRDDIKALTRDLKTQQDTIQALKETTSKQNDRLTKQNETIEAMIKAGGVMKMK